MRIWVHIGPDAGTSGRVQRLLGARRQALQADGVLYARSPGTGNHTRLFMAVSGAVDALRLRRGHATPAAQAALFADLQAGLRQEIARHSPEVLILSAHELGSHLTGRQEVARLHDLLAPFSRDIRIVAQIDDPARLLCWHFARQVMEGRARDLSLELETCGAPDWWAAALATRPAPWPARGLFAECQGAVHWLDTARLAQEWEAAMGAGRVDLHSTPADGLAGDAAGARVAALFDLPPESVAVRPEPRPRAPAAAWLSRCRRMNDALLRLQAHEGFALPRPLWRKFLHDIEVEGPPIAPGSLATLSKRFAGDLCRLAAVHPGLHPAELAPDPAVPGWSEADPERGFRSTQYLLAFAPRLARVRARADTAATPRPPRGSPGTALPGQVGRTLEKLCKSRLAPHNRLGSVDETAPGAAFHPVERATPRNGTGRLVLACMKNEAPYVLEWIAYHRLIGFDRFLVYTNDCEDGTVPLLERLQEMGLVRHRDNSEWHGKSPQQHALNMAMHEDEIRAADWIAHIDVDEFVNVRCGNGTLDDLLSRLPQATNIAMTWRMFGHNGVTRIADSPVIAQFDHCAPSYCPKPHTAWGFKTLFRNVGAYGKIGCHRPNKLRPDKAAQVRWVNGSGQDMTAHALRNGWRNSVSTAGYDLVQLNHYALRSAEAFLVKRLRGRALHVDRTIGLNYWIRMDWSDCRDITIQRNLPRLRAALATLLADPVLARWHRAALDWHRAKAAELRQDPEWDRLYRHVTALRLTAAERAAYALTLEMDS